MLTLEDAIELAVIAHKGQKDLSGRPYILHPLTVMMDMCTDAERIVAILHDVTEDTEHTLEDLDKLGLTEEMYDALHLLDKNNYEGEKIERYRAMITAIKGHPLARVVKIADLKHNMDLRRIIGREDMNDKDMKRIKQYTWAWSFLTGE